MKQSETKKLRGFAAMPPQKRIEIARKGGLAAWHGEGGGRPHRWTSEQAAYFGSIGGRKSRRKPGKRKASSTKTES